MQNVDILLIEGLGKLLNLNGGPSSLTIELVGAVGLFNGDFLGELDQANKDETEVCGALGGVGLNPNRRETVILKIRKINGVCAGGRVVNNKVVAHHHRLDSSGRFIEYGKGLAS